MCVDSCWDGRVLHILFWVTLTLTLTADLISRLFFLSGAYLLYNKKLSQLCLMLDQFLLGGICCVLDRFTKVGSDLPLYNTSALK